MNKNLKPVVAAVGATFAGAMMMTNVASAAQNPFGLTELNSGYMQLADSHGGGEKKEAEAKKDGEGKCGAGKCGGEKKDGEGKCGTGKCGGDKKADGEKKDGEGKCGAGKCGGDKGK